MNATLAMLLALGAGLALVGGLAYWQLVVAEGAYLGRRVVVWLYDRYAPRYEVVKHFDPQFDHQMLAAPVVDHLNRSGLRRARVLDVASGTGRFARAILAAPAFEGSVLATDLSPRMLAIATHLLAPYAARAETRLADAEALGLPDAGFDVVACLEALEFMPHPTRALAELQRVCAPGGLLVLSNRIGPDAWKMPGRTESTKAFVTRLSALGLRNVRVLRWLVDYDLVLATKPDAPATQQNAPATPA
ncbi:MAG: class I SAM-dependent methyltransferase [Thermoflexales bacterium]|nr:class I SAM-dependent methyltransferase [Thermoflexales bacterium]